MGRCYVLTNQYHGVLYSNVFYETFTIMFCFEYLSDQLSRLNKMVLLVKEEEEKKKNKNKKNKKKNKKNKKNKNINNYRDEFCFCGKLVKFEL